MRAASENKLERDMHGTSKNLRDGWSLHTIISCGNPSSRMHGDDGQRAREGSSAPDEIADANQGPSAPSVFAKME